MTTPQLNYKPAIRYLSVPISITMEGLEDLNALFPQIEQWMAEHGISPAGPALDRAHTIDMERELRMEACVPYDGTIDADLPDGWQLGETPAGIYLSLTPRVAGLDEGVEANRVTIEYAESHGLRWKNSRNDAGEEVWGGRLQFRLDDTLTEIAFLIDESSISSTFPNS